MQTKKIQQLPQSVISKIAAGEVIERPVYAVKELIENSLDAGADTIKVIIEESGLKRISVIDNGVGMNVDDLKESFKPHTTSKLKTEDDLHQITTLGFRGEALSSIAAISHMTISSRTNDAAGGYSLKVVGGVPQKISPFGMPAGTQITVEDLFYPVPARKKFLKSQRTEFRLIIDVLTNFAFSHPQVQFVLVHNGKTIFDLPKVSDALDRIMLLLGKDIYTNLLPLQFNDSYITVKGFLAKPQVTTKTPHKQFLFINNRKVNHKDIAITVKSAYGTMLEKQAYPICLLFFSIPHEIVDVNVHPKKEEVRFMNTQQVLDAIEKAVVQTLVASNLTFHKSSWKTAVFLGDTDKPFTGKSTHSYAGRLLKEQQLPWQLVQEIKNDPSQIMQMHSLYLVTQSTDGIAFIDQHAAHERILYEQYLEEFLNKKRQKKVHTFTKPKLIELAMSDVSLLEEHLDQIERSGFLLEHFKGHSYLIRSVPELLQDLDVNKLLSEVLENLRIDVGGSDFEVDGFSGKMIAYLACRSAVKAGDTLTREQANDLLEQLAKTTNNATCPHGRPTKVILDLPTINKMFKR